MGAYKFYNPTTQQWEIIKSKSIIKDDGSLEYTPDDIKAIDNKIGILSGAGGTKEKANKSDLVDLQSEVGAHKADKANPHGTTKTHVGLGSVLNYALATKAEAEAGTSNVKYMTPLRVRESIDNNAQGITESGSNSRGEYIKFDDGTLICYQKTTITLSGDETGIYAWYYPTPFVSNSRPIPLVSGGTSSGAVANGSKLRVGFSGSADGLGPSHTYLEASIHNLDTKERDMKIYFIALGRWK